MRGVIPRRSCACRLHRRLTSWATRRPNSVSLAHNASEVGDVGRRRSSGPPWQPGHRAGRAWCRRLDSGHAGRRGGGNMQHWEMGVVHGVRPPVHHWRVRARRGDRSDTTVPEAAGCPVNNEDMPGCDDGGQGHGVGGVDVPCGGIPAHEEGRGGASVLGPLGGLLVGAVIRSRPASVGNCRIHNHSSIWDRQHPLCARWALHIACNRTGDDWQAVGSAAAAGADTGGSGPHRARPDRECDVVRFAVMAA